MDDHEVALFSQKYSFAAKLIKLINPLKEENGTSAIYVYK
jgi:hypothetical protein